LEIVKARKSVVDRVLSEAKKWASTLPIRCTAYLIGSYARGDFNLWSDIDILLVSDDLVGSPVERLKKIEAPPNYEVLPLTTREFRRMLGHEDSLAKEALKRGVALRDDLNLYTLQHQLKEQP
jgi:predicted nucleotidyltransferase